MRAIILAAGEGSKLHPSMGKKPKCLVPLRGKPLLQYQIEALRASGIEDIRLVGGYQASELQSFKLPVIINRCFATTSTVFSLFAAHEWLDEDVLVVYGDCVYEPRVIRLLIENKAPVAVAQAEGRSIGLMRVAKDEWPALKQGFIWSAHKEMLSIAEFLQREIEEGLQIKAIPVSHGWPEVDSLEDLGFYESTSFNPALSQI